MGLWSWVLPGTYVDKLSIKGGKDVVETMADFVCTAQPQRKGGNASASQPSPGTPTAFAPTTAEQNDPAGTFSIQDGYLAVASDPSATGTSSVQNMPYLENWEFDWDNGMIQKPFWDGGRVYKAYPGIATAQMKYTYTNYSLRPSEFEDYIDTVLIQKPSFFADMANNIGSSSTPSWQAIGIYVPSQVISQPSIKRSLTDAQQIDVTTEAVYTGTDMAQIDVLNSVTVASAAY
jgi:hypothetical protein